MMFILFRILLTLLPAVLCSACGKHTSTAGSRQDAAPSHVVETSSAVPALSELPLPDVPADLVTPEERADFVCLHFWDKLDFARAATQPDTAFIEQSFANFASVLPLASDKGRTQAVNRLLDAALNAATPFYEYMLDLAEFYLYAPGSPMYNERLFVPFLEYELTRADNDLSPAGYKLADIARNAPGSPAPDFAFTRPDGTQGHLLRPGSQAGILLMFYEPDCDRCHRAVSLLDGNDVLRRAVEDGALRVVMIYPGDDTRTWQADLSTVPVRWEVGIDTSRAIDEERLYLVRATPSFYLLSPDGVVVLKDAPLTAVAEALGLND